MRRRPTTYARQTMPAVASLLSAVAMLALAGPAAAHHSGDDRSGFGDDDVAGQIASFDSESGMLAIDLSGGGSASGMVTSRTWIENDDDRCESWGRRRSFHGWCRRQLHHFDPGDNHGWHHGWDHGPNGSTDDLVPGATVEDALLVLKDGGAFFWKVELAD